MTETRTYPHGVPCWVDVAQPDADAAAAFYGGLFGWTFEDVAGAYLIASLAGANVAGIERGDGAAWSTYVAVDDADAAVRAVRDAGGTIEREAADAGPGGREARIADPQGARLRLWQARARPGAQLVNAPGSWNFSDLHTRDPAAARAFYLPLFGWEIEDLGFAAMIRRPDTATTSRRPSIPGSTRARPASARRPASRTRSPGSPLGRGRARPLARHLRGGRPRRRRRRGRAPRCHGRRLRGHGVDADRARPRPAGRDAHAQPVRSAGRLNDAIAAITASTAATVNTTTRPWWNGAGDQVAGRTPGRSAPAGVRGGQRARARRSARAGAASG